MATLESAGKWLVAVMLSAATVGCVSLSEYDAVARANLQLQDKMAACQAESVKARTQVALLRQELVQAKQEQQAIREQLKAMTAERDTLNARLDVRARQQQRAAQTQPTQVKPAAR